MKIEESGNGGCMKAKSPIAGVCCVHPWWILTRGIPMKIAPRIRKPRAPSLHRRWFLAESIRESNQQSQSRYRLQSPEGSEKRNRRWAGLAPGRCVIQRPFQWRMGLWEGARLRASGIIRSSTSQKAKSRFESVRVESEHEKIGNHSEVREVSRTRAGRRRDSDSQT